jgi:hypothetical protein
VAGSVGEFILGTAASRPIGTRPRTYKRYGASR